MSKNKRKKRSKRAVPSSTASLPEGNSSSNVDNKKQRTEKAIGKAETEVKIDTLSFHDAFTTGLAFEQLQSLDGALAAFQRAVECDPNHFDALIHLADVHSAIGQHDAALERYKQASKLKDGKEVASLWFRLGVTYSAMMQQTKATFTYKKALELYEKKLKLQDTKETFLVQLKKDHSVTLAALAESFGELGDLDSAVKVYEDAVLKHPNDANMHYNLANMRLARSENTGNTSFDTEVMKCLERALQLCPETLEFVKDLAEYLEAHDQQPDRVCELKRIAKDLSSLDLE
ncbi:FOG: TPR repeat [Plasmopara halstedii]|uniref:FOG: TPR repeat n=1 Tax=Plasmopara halstedii TaxID=4781 RepID=A0A0P1AKC4_PLAHL|nr:FOG: TPR repeat [Plasmopara halstedii]CEG41841.1 FOG: TPR repeat [Plasmopara halstedii]|eukprot:XP_024578210.1 FOG: TPR repeat [Plasmopara halstedii]